MSTRRKVFAAIMWVSLYLLFDYVYWYYFPESRDVDTEGRNELFRAFICLILTALIITNIDKPATKISLIIFTIASTAFIYQANSKEQKKTNESPKQWHTRQINSIDTSKYGIAVDHGEIIIICEKQKCGRYNEDICFTHVIERYYNTTDNVEATDSTNDLMILNNREKTIATIRYSRQLPLPRNLDTLSWRQYRMFEQDIEDYVLTHLNKELDAVNYEDE